MRDLLILGIVFGSLPFILIRPWLGILMWYWIGLMNPHRLAWGVAVNFPVAQVVALAALGSLLLTKDRKPIPITRETLLLGLFTIHITITTYFAWAPTAWNQWDTVMKILLLTFITLMLIHGRERITWLIIIAVLSIGFYGLKGGIFSLATGGAYNVLGPRRSFIEGNTNLGMALIMVLPLMLVMARAAREGRLGISLLDRWRTPLGYFGYATFGLTVIAILFTYSRGAWVGLALVAPFIYLKMRYKFVLALTSILMVGSILAMLPERLVDRFETIQAYQDDYSAMQRLQAWGVNWNMAMDRPLVGTGFNNPDIGSGLWLSYANWVEPWASQARAAHSIFFQVIGHHGFLGGFIYFTMMLLTVLALRRIHREAASHPSTAWMKDIAWALMVGFVGFFVAGAFIDMAYFPLVYVFLALTVLMKRELDQAEATETRTAPVASAGAAPRRGPMFPNFVATSRSDQRS